MVKCFNFTLKLTDECQKSKSEICKTVCVYVRRKKKKRNY